MAKEPVTGVFVAVPLVEKPDGSLTAPAERALADEYAVLRLQMTPFQAKPNLRGWLFWRYESAQGQTFFAGASDPAGLPLRRPFCDVQACMAGIDFEAVELLGRLAYERQARAGKG
jgi:hypothetical protein